jgi:hypothetical protein
MTRVKRQFGDESGVQVTDADIIRWINDGQRRIVMHNEGLLETTALRDLTKDVQEYDLPADLLIFRAISLKVTGDTTYRHIKGLDFSKFNEYIDGWDGDTLNRAVPLVYTLFAGKIRFYPIPNQTVTNGIKIYYNRKPTDVTGSSSAIDLPLLYHETVATYCLQQAHEMDEDYDAAGMKASEMSTDLTTLRGREEWKEQETYPTITVLPEDM